MFQEGKYVDGTPDEIAEHANKARLEVFIPDDSFKPNELVEARKEEAIKQIEQNVLGKGHSDMLDKAREAQENNR